MNELTTPNLIAGQWYITTGPFEHDGQVVAGPFSTRAEATGYREALERATGNLTHWVDHAPCLLWCCVNG
jgi:hypothetical protein